MKKRCAIFDLDGTLLDTVDDLANAVNTALLENGFPTHPREKYFYFVGKGARNLIRRALPEGVDDATYEAVYQRYTAYYEENWNVCTKPYPGIPELIARLLADGIRMAVVSNKPDDRTKAAIFHYFPDTFDVVFGGRDNVPLKPSPAAVQEALSLLDCTAEEAVYIGDTSVDIETGKNAGIFTVGVLWGFRGAEELTAAGADILCATAGELYDLIKKESL
ncbi:MAG: HAD family hydrolase [Ruminococcaceae bacterium]|nr:HAD family hydrolase [Oscillospiraceae bacterium]